MSQLRHPRYVAVLALAILTTLFLLNPLSQSTMVVHTSDQGLPARLARAEQTYQNMLGRRKGLIERFGPQPKDIEKCSI
jgi:hypothetical protein